MKHAIAIAMILAASAAHATTNGNVTRAVSSSESTSVAGAVAGGGDASAIGRGGSASSEGASSTVTVDASERTQAPAPSIALVAGSGTMECIRGFGIGGSNQNGAIVFGPSWKDKDCTAVAQMETLRAMGLPVAAANAYCSRPAWSRPFGTRAHCEAEVSRALGP